MMRRPCDKIPLGIVEWAVEKAHSRFEAPVKDASDVQQLVEPLFWTRSGYTQGALWASYPSVHGGNVSVYDSPKFGKIIVFTSEEGNPFDAGVPVGIICGHSKRWGGVFYEETTRLPMDGLLAAAAGLRENHLDELHLGLAGPWRWYDILRGLNCQELDERTVRDVLEYLVVSKGASVKINAPMTIPILAKFVKERWAELARGTAEEQWTQWGRGAGRSLGTCPIPVVHVLPKRIVEAQVKMVEKGWHPLVPMWQNLTGHIYNHGWTGPCGAGPGVNQRWSGVARKFLQGQTSAFTLHMGRTTTTKDHSIPTIWERQFVRACEALAEEEAPGPTMADAQVEMGLGVEAARSVGIVVRGSGGDQQVFMVRNPKGWDGEVEVKHLGELKVRVRAVAALSEYQEKKVVPLIGKGWKLVWQE